jgi:hypothetical protein
MCCFSSRRWKKYFLVSFSIFGHSLFFLIALPLASRWFASTLGYASHEVVSIDLFKGKINWF